MRRGCGVCVCGTLLMCGRSRKSGCESGAQLEHQEYKHLHYTLRPCTRSHANVFPFDPPSSTSKCAPRCTPVASPRSTWNLLHSPLARPLLNRRTEEAGGDYARCNPAFLRERLCFPPPLPFRLPAPTIHTDERHAEKPRSTVAPRTPARADTRRSTSRRERKRSGVQATAHVFPLSRGCDRRRAWSVGVGGGACGKVAREDAHMGREGSKELLAPGGGGKVGRSCREAHRHACVLVPVFVLCMR